MRRHVCACGRMCACMSEIWQPGEGWNSWETASRVTGSKRLGTSGRLSVCLPLAVRFSVRFPASPSFPCLHFHLFLPKRASLSLPPSLPLFQPSLPPSLKGNTQPGETAPKAPKEGTGPGCISVQAGLPWQPRGTAPAPSWARRLGTGSKGNDSWFTLGHMSAWVFNSCGAGVVGISRGGGDTRQQHLRLEGVPVGRGQQRLNPEGRHTC